MDSDGFFGRAASAVRGRYLAGKPAPKWKDGFIAVTVLMLVALALAIFFGVENAKGDGCKARVIPLFPNGFKPKPKPIPAHSPASGPGLQDMPMWTPPTAPPTAPPTTPRPQPAPQPGPQQGGLLGAPQSVDEAVMRAQAAQRRSFEQAAARRNDGVAPQLGDGLGLVPVTLPPGVSAAEAKVHADYATMQAALQGVLPEAPARLPPVMQHVSGDSLLHASASGIKHTGAFGDVSNDDQSSAVLKELDPESYEKLEKAMKLTGVGQLWGMDEATERMHRRTQVVKSMMLAGNPGATTAAVLEAGPVFTATRDAIQRSIRASNDLRNVRIPPAVSKTYPSLVYRAPVPRPIMSPLAGEMTPLTAGQQNYLAEISCGNSGIQDTL
jgi:hypothetical protein